MKKVNVGNAQLLVGKLPEWLVPDDIRFQELWDLHPNGFNKIAMYDKEVFIPRWQQAYGVDYTFSNQTSKALPVPNERVWKERI